MGNGNVPHYIGHWQPTANNNDDPLKHSIWCQPMDCLALQQEIQQFTDTMQTFFDSLLASTGGHYAATTPTNLTDDWTHYCCQMTQWQWNDQSIITLSLLPWASISVVCTLPNATSQLALCVTLAWKISHTCNCLFNNICWQWPADTNATLLAKTPTSISTWHTMPPQCAALMHSGCLWTMSCQHNLTAYWTNLAHSACPQNPFPTQLDHPATHSVTLRLWVGSRSMLPLPNLLPLCWHPSLFPNSFNPMPSLPRYCSGNSSLSSHLCQQAWPEPPNLLHTSQ